MVDHGGIHQKYVLPNKIESYALGYVDFIISDQLSDHSWEWWKMGVVVFSWFGLSLSLLLSVNAAFMNDLHTVN